MSQELDNLRQKLEDIRGQAPQFLDVKHRNDIVSRYRASLRMMIAECRHLEELQKDSHDPLDQLYLGYDILFIKKQIRERFHHYKTAVNDAFETQDIYTNSLAQESIRKKMIRMPNNAANTNRKAA